MHRAAWSQGHHSPLLTQGRAQGQDRFNEPHFQKELGTAADSAPGCRLRGREGTAGLKRSLLFTQTQPPQREGRERGSSSEPMGIFMRARAAWHSMAGGQGTCDVRVREQMAFHLQGADFEPPVLDDVYRAATLDPVNTILVGCCVS